MAASIRFKSQPPKLVLSGNQVIFQVLADNYLKTSGVKARFWLTYVPHVDEILGISYKGLETIIEIGVGANKWNWPTEPFADFLNKQPNLVDYFYITSLVEGAQHIATFEAKEKGADLLTISQHSPDNYQGGYFVTELTAGVDRTKNTLHRVVANLVMDNQVIKSDWFTKDPDEIQANPLTGQADINVSQYLVKNKTAHFTFPEPNDNKFFKTHNILDKVKVYFFESWGIPVSKSQLITSDDLYVLHGKLNPAAQAELNEVQNTFYSSVINSGRFLTDQPSEKVTDIYAPERLYWFADKAYSSLNLKITYYFSDASVETTNTNIQSIAANTIVEILTGYKRIKLSTTKTIVKYDVQVYSGAVSVSAKQTYIISRDYQHHARYFFVQNRYGVYDLFRTVGTTVKKKKITKQTVSVALPDNHKTTDRSIRQIDSKAAAQYNLNTGYLRSDKEAEWVGQMLESTDVFWLKKSKGYPVVFLDSDNQMYRDGEYNNNLEVDIQHANGDDIPEEFSPLEPIEIGGDYSIDYNSDYFTGATNPDVPPVDPPPSNVLFQSDFTNWVADPDPKFPLQPVGMDISSGVENVSIANDNNRLAVTINNPNDWVQAYFKSPANVFYPGRYKITIEIDQVAGYPRLEFSSPFGFHDLTEGLNVIDKTLDSPAFCFIRFFQPGTCIISNIRIEKIV